MSQRSEEDEEKFRLFKMRLRGNVSDMINVGPPTKSTKESEKEDEEFIRGVLAREKFLNEQKKNKK